MRIAIAQFESGADRRANVERAEATIREASERGADLIILPEVWNVGYFAFEDYEVGAETLDGRTISKMRRLAEELDIHLHTGSIIERADDRLYNMSALLSPDGDILDTYRKIHLFGYESEETQRLTPGSRIVVVETDLGVVGLSTCYDLRFPALFRACSDRGVEVLLVTSAWPQSRIEHWHLLTRVRALENHAFLAAANLSGTNHGVELAGQSVIVDPWGVVIANAGVEGAVAIADVDLDEVAHVREEFPTVADRRFELTYSLREPTRSEVTPDSLERY